MANTGTGCFKMSSTSSLDWAKSTVSTMQVIIWSTSSGNWLLLPHLQHLNLYRNRRRRQRRQLQTEEMKGRKWQAKVSLQIHILKKARQPK